jgi:hypothetical protein
VKRPRLRSHCEISDPGFRELRLYSGAYETADEMHDSWIVPMIATTLRVTLKESAGKCKLGRHAAASERGNVTPSDHTHVSAKGQCLV